MMKPIAAQAENLDADLTDRGGASTHPHVIPGGARMDHLDVLGSAVLESLPGIVTISPAEDPDTLLYVSTEVERMLGYSAEEWRRNQALRLLALHPEDTARVLHDLLLAQAERRLFQMEYRLVSTDHRTVWVQHTTRLLHGGGPGPYHLSLLMDVSVRKAAEEAMQEAAMLDSLTGLYNRRGFFHLAEQQTRLARRRTRSGTVFFVDVDGLKEINDTWGHSEGDRVIRDAADVLRDTFRTTDVLGRIGGDEFAIFALETDGDRTELLGRRLRSNLERFNAQSGRPYRLSFSFGTAFYSSPTLSVHDLLDAADKALYAERRRAAAG